MSNLSSIDPTKAKAMPPATPATPVHEPKKAAVDLEYTPSTPASSGPATPPTPWSSQATCLDVSTWPDDLLERGITAIRIRLAKDPASVSADDRARLDQMESVLASRYAPKPSSTGVASATGAPAPKSAVAILADSGVSLRGGLEKAHELPLADLQAYIREYTDYVASRTSDPKYAKLHADALVEGPKLLAERSASDEKKQLDALRFEVGVQAAQDKAGSLQVKPPAGVVMGATVGAVSIPIAQAVDFAMSMAPIVGQLWSGLEVASGKAMGGIGLPISDTERIVSAAILLAPYAGKLLSKGAAAAGAVLEIAKRTGKPATEVVELLARARAVAKDTKTLEEAVTLLKAGKPLGPQHEAALARAEEAFAFRARRYQPTKAGTSALPAGEGRTDKYGNVVYSTLGSKEQIALAKAHEEVHSLLSPKTLNGLRELRADIGIAAYGKSSFLRYVEEAAAEVTAQVKVKGATPGNVLTGIKFPVTNGYVTLLPSKKVLADGTVEKQLGVLPEAVVGTIVYAGTVYAVVRVADATVTEVQKAKQAP